MCKSIKNQLLAFLKEQKITECGVAPYPVSPYCCAVVCLFPYYTGQPNNCLSKYAQGLDYHLVVKKYLAEACAFIKQLEPDALLEVMVDNNPLPERYLAYQAGLGIIGQNQCLIHKDYGSYVFIGSILTNLSLPPDSPMQGSCMQCGKCQKFCPSQALSPTGFCQNKCMSEITQKRQLTSEEEILVSHAQTIWGCDVCQDVCPHNASAALSPFAEFYEETPSLQGISSLSNREFQKKFGNRAFAWRGKKVLERNIKLQCK